MARCSLSAICLACLFHSPSAQAQQTPTDDSPKTLQLEIKKLQRQVEDLTQANKEIQDQVRKNLDALAKTLTDAIAGLGKKADSEEVLRRQMQILEKQMLETVRSREQQLAALEAERKVAMQQAVAQKVQIEILQSRNEELLKRVKELEEFRARVGRDEPLGKNPQVKDLNSPNPPQGFVKGAIEKIDKGDNGLMKITLGSDHGVMKGHTLEVYRLKPRPEYVGRVQVIESTDHYSVARFLRNPNTPNRVPQEGDIVASRLEK